jgi:hypothetical protein
MPFTPYHFGPGGFIGLVFGKWIETICMLFFIAAFVVYILAVTVFRKNWIRGDE